MPDKPKPKETAVALSSAASTEPQAIPGVPGLWTVGEPVHPASLGMTLGDLTGALDEAGVEYKRVKVAPYKPPPEPEPEAEPVVTEVGAGAPAAVGSEAVGGPTPAATPPPALDTSGGGS